MNRFIVSSGWVFLASIVLVLVFMPFDAALSERAQGLPGRVVGFNSAITDLGTFRWMLYSSGLVIIIAFIAGKVYRNSTYVGKLRTGYRLFLYFFLTIASAGILVHLLKFLIGRARPELFSELGAFSLTPFAGQWSYESFPSGHSTAIGALCGALAMLTPHLRPVFLLLALIIGISRVIVGAHYPSDVAAGLLLGVWTAMAFAFIFAGYNWLFRFDEKGWPQPKSVFAAKTADRAQ